MGSGQSPGVRRESVEEGAKDMANANQVKDDEWLHTVCDNCFSYCGILAHRVNGTVVKIEGDPDAPNSRGKVCAKGQAGVIGLYDPSRVKTPLKRTNPEKGIGVDPQWQPISWDEAIDIVAKKPNEVRKDDPRKVVVSSFDVPVIHKAVEAWCAAYGTPNSHWVGYYCGNYLHSSMYLTNGTFHSDYDIEYCNYLILLGNQSGFMIGVNANTTTQKMAEARARGMHVVAVDPICSHAASKADEWVPIRPGTDGALMLAMSHVLLHEMNLYDSPFLRQYSNAPYLVGNDGYYVRDAAGKPQVWDPASGQARTHDAGVRSPPWRAPIRLTASPAGPPLCS